jgi:hypothetical protein
MTANGRAFPDLHVTVEDMVEEGDKVVGRNTVTGTHQGEYMGLPATGKSVTYREIIIFRFVNGRIAETWGVVDVFSQMKQLGMIPAWRRPSPRVTSLANGGSPCRVSPRRGPVRHRGPETWRGAHRVLRSRGRRNRRTVV